MQKNTRSHCNYIPTQNYKNKLGMERVVGFEKKMSGTSEGHIFCNPTFKFKVVSDQTKSIHLGFSSVIDSRKSTGVM